MDKLADKVSEAARAKTETEQPGSRRPRGAEDRAGESLRPGAEAWVEGEYKDRAPDGKFKSEADNTRDAQALGAEAEQPAAKPASTRRRQGRCEGRPEPKDGVKTAAEQQDKPVSQPAVKQPSSSAPEKKAVWDAMSPEAQAHVAQREQEVPQGDLAARAVRQTVRCSRRSTRGLQPWVFEARAYRSRMASASHGRSAPARSRSGRWASALAKAYGVDLYGLQPSRALTRGAAFRFARKWLSCANGGRRQHHDRIAQQRAQAQQVDHLGGRSPTVEKTRCISAAWKPT